MAEYEQVTPYDKMNRKQLIQALMNDGVTIGELNLKIATRDDQNSNLRREQASLIHKVKILESDLAKSKELLLKRSTALEIRDEVISGLVKLMSEDKDELDLMD